MSSSPFLVCLILALSVSSFESVSTTGGNETFTNPLNQQKGADPCMRYLNGNYFLTTTQNESITMWSAPTIEGIKNATPKVLFTDSTPGRNHRIWAPEFTFIDDTWYMHYCAAGLTDDDASHRNYVASGGNDPNDPSAGPYTFVNSLIPENFDTAAIDSHVFSIADQMYMAFADQSGCLYLVGMNGPTEVIGNATQISCAEFDWEMVGAPVNEGPESITINNVTHIVYSASLTFTDAYALGLLTLTPGSDPLLKSSWTKKPDPIFSTDASVSVYAPGHHFMFKIEGDWYFAYHARSTPNSTDNNARTTRVQPFSINATSNEPIFPKPIAIGVPEPEPVQ